MWRASSSAPHRKSGARQMKRRPRRWSCTPRSCRRPASSCRTGEMPPQTDPRRKKAKRRPSLRGRKNEGRAGAARARRPAALAEAAPRERRTRRKRQTTPARRTPLVAQADGKRAAPQRRPGGKATRGRIAVTGVAPAGSEVHRASGASREEGVALGSSKEAHPGDDRGVARGSGAGRSGEAAPAPADPAPAPSGGALLRGADHGRGPVREQLQQEEEEEEEEQVGMATTDPADLEAAAEAAVLRGVTAGREEEKAALVANSAEISGEGTARGATSVGMPTAMSRLAEMHGNQPPRARAKVEILAPEIGHAPVAG